MKDDDFQQGLLKQENSYNKQSLPNKIVSCIYGQQCHNCKQ